MGVMDLEGNTANELPLGTVLPLLFGNRRPDPPVQQLSPLPRKIANSAAVIL